MISCISAAFRLRSTRPRVMNAWRPAYGKGSLRPRRRKQEQSATLQNITSEISIFQLTESEERIMTEKSCFPKEPLPQGELLLTSCSRFRFLITFTQMCTGSFFLNARDSRWDSEELHGGGELCGRTFFASTGIHSG